MAQGIHSKRSVLEIDGVYQAAKECTKCGEMKVLDDFGKTKSTADKRVSACKQCKRRIGIEYRTKPGSKEVAKKYRDEHREEFNESNRRYYRRNSVAINAKSVKWAKENREQYNRTSVVTQNRRRAMKMSLLSEYDPADSKMARSLYEGCILTGDTTNLHDDHFIALSTGHCGTYLANMVPLRADLNISKKASNPFEWLAVVKEVIDIERFVKALLILSHLNGINVEDYIEFVYWCYDNPRTKEEITDDNRDSLAYWMRITGKQYTYEMEVI